MPPRSYPGSLASYFRVPRGIVAGLPKCGVTSIRRALLHNAPEVPEPEVLASREPLHLFLRDPVDRLISAWSHLRNEDQCPPALADRPDYETFVDRVLAGAEDAHWRPQMEALVREPDRIYPFERISEHFPAVTGRAIEHHNASHPPRVNDLYRLDELWQLYHADIKAHIAVLTRL